MFDLWVYNSQVWVNSHYAGVAGYIPVTEDGQTGFPTMFALTRALQHELGISALSDAFGTTTLAQLVAQVGDVTASSPPNIVALVQCGLWCKGYSGGEIGTWSPTVATSIASMQSSMGLAATSALKPKAFKSLLTMDAYVRIGSGTEEVRAVQQWLNGSYYGRANYFIVPCDGIFSRDVQKGLIYAIQYEIGMTDSVANGSFGPGTQQGLRDYGVFGVGYSDTSRRLVRLFQAALRVNKYSPPFDGVFGSSTSAAASTFQSFAQLPTSGGANFATWASLLVSTGDPTRAGVASDTSTPLTAGKAASIYGAGYRTVGRYLNGTTKNIRAGELGILFNAGLTLFPIYQEWNNESQWFTEAIGLTQGTAAARRARQLGIKEGATIYFPVDYDPTSDEITAKILPYFRKVKEGIETSRRVSYRIGVYGTRNTCTRVSDAGLASSSFIAGMSTGWSGNLGFTLPTNWAYDQIQETTVGAGANSIAIDKNIRSSTAEPLDSADVLPTPVITGTSGIGYNDFYWWVTELTHKSEIPDFNNVIITDSDRVNFITHLMKSPLYSGGYWDVYTPKPEDVPGGNPLRQIALIGARDAYEQSASALPAAATAAYRGQIDHWAATVEGYMNYGTLGAFGHSSTCQIADLGGWALDLAQVWSTYATKRRNGTYTAGAKSWMKTKVGSTDQVAGFDIKDLVADVDAYIVAYELNEDASRPMSDILREILVESQADPRWRFQRFYSLRFGSRTVLEAAVRDVFVSSAIWINTPVQAFVGDRRPGQSASPVNAGDPTGTELAQELNEMVAGFADRLIAFATDATVAAG